MSKPANADTLRDAEEAVSHQSANINYLRLALIGLEHDYWRAVRVAAELGSVHYQALLADRHRQNQR